ncbi:DUF4852 domain-containing protein [Telmatospirillum sp. J64-1]|uniref:DUF4852 domain-containing protein n=1 Tax=Telmatospirillum sp. J64-1 TaxID=2502183 RepID=UPI00115CAC23|nr:DUF4852 domain-containing protein [Telmatospirillum sp. J64-1]
MGTPSRNAATWGLAGILAASVSLPVQAKETRLAFSERLGIEILAQDAGSGWCQPDLSLVIKAKSADFFTTPDFPNLMQTVGTRILPSECPVAERISLTGIEEASGKTLYRGTTGKAGNWALVADSPPPSEASVAEAPSAETVPVVEETPSAPVPPVAAAEPPVDLRKLSTPFTHDALLMLYLKADLARLEDEKLMRSILANRDCSAFQKAAQNEFVLPDYLKKSTETIKASLAEGNPYLRMVLRSEFGRYDNEKKGFEFSPVSGQGSSDPEWSACYREYEEAPFPYHFNWNWAVPGMITHLPMAREQAEPFLGDRQKRSSNQRQVFTEIILTPVFAEDEILSGSYAGASVTLMPREITVYDDEKLTKPLFRWDGATLAELEREAKARALAEAEKLRLEREKAEAEEKRMAALRRVERDMSRLRYASLQSRVAYMIGADKLSLSRAVVGRAIITGQPQPVALLVQADGNGRGDVPTRWPANLRLSAEEGQEAFEKGRWYVISGDLTAQEGRSLPVGSIKVRKMVVCAKDGCEEAEDVEALVQRRIAEIDAEAGQ